MKLTKLRISVAVALAGLVGSANAGSYAFQAIPMQPGESRSPNAIAASGAVTGSLSIPGVGAKSFLYKDSILGVLADGPGFGLNSQGTVAGGFGAGYVFEDGIETPIPGAAVAWDVNEAGTVVGEANSGGAFIYKDGIVEAFTIDGRDQAFAIDINNAGAVVGTAHMVNGSERLAFVRHVDGTIDTIPSPNGGISQGAAINDAGQVLVIVQGDGNTSTFQFWENGVLTDTGVPWNTVLVAQTIQIQMNNLGQFVTSDGLYSEGVFTPAADLLPPEYVGEGTDGIFRMSHKVTGINDAGQIVGAMLEIDLSVFSFKQVGFVLTPSTLCN